MTQPFIPEQEYKRTDLHKQYGGNAQSGISNCANYPYIFIFSGVTGKQHGYKDGWENPNVFEYTGEGQMGDMSFTRGNLALRDHIDNGKQVFLFQYQRSGIVKYICELEFYDTDYFPTHDSSKQLRVGIRFFLKRKGAILPSVKELNQSTDFLAAESIPFYGIDSIKETSRKGEVNLRVGQGAYRKSIIHHWQYKCAVTGFDKLNLLNASHIHPWKDATDKERLDVNNGILLSPTYDALFDKHLISFENDGKIILSDTIHFSAYQKIGVTGKEKIKELNSNSILYIEKHRHLLLKY
ncbi:HNH endonuclease [Cytophaga hutchinsonii]|uniref:Restriction endonuclease n=1 Tax=Cytophaga hutchinsonii (strain ATCC 33406 / DSM 1761 / CIP 103989 / NBRC 15051 / NCIMB 9469 / D465) TaxID=269798 RepID=A0A6N4SNC1_CYTH3|nr:HNH endonuclease [Cytophaga hutchinsonii]ABG57790.1 restriction endonuclease [Cytophaga hutchinsonii ATCC 33406]SFX05664.1 SAD/SRA domain-containing protein [Cytophaga hutchinsonii ATCC 33406]